MSFESCAFHLCMLSHGLLQMGSRHAPACPQQSVGRHGRRSAPNQHFATAVPMGSRDAGRGSPPGTRRRTAPIQADHPRGRGDEAGSPSSFASSNAAEVASAPPPSCVKGPTFQMDCPSGNSQCDASVAGSRTRRDSTSAAPATLPLALPTAAREARGLLCPLASWATPAVTRDHMHREHTG